MLDTGAAAKMLEISEATVRNWHRAGLLPSVASQPLRFDPAAVAGLRSRLAAGSLDRLNRRANQMHRTHPVRTADRPTAAFQAALWLDLAPADRRAVAVRLLELGLALAVRRGEAASPEAALAGVFRRGNLALLFRQWNARLGSPSPQLPHIRRLADRLGRPGAPERPGAAAVQFLAAAGDRSRRGAFFTPPATTRAIASELGRPGRSILDPACGTGDFLLEFLLEGGATLADLHGFDIDPDTVDFARLNLLLHSREARTMPDIRCLDALKSATGERFDLVVGNPPWGGVFDRSAAARRWPELGGATDSFAAFVALGLELAKPSGRVSLLLPESLLTVRRHHGCRRYLEAHAETAPVRPLGRIFRGVLSPAVRLDFRPAAAAPSGGAPLRLSGGGDRLVRELLAVPHRTLAGHAEFMIGIVTGDNRRLLHPVPAAGMEPVWRGSGVQPFRFGRPAGYLKFDPAAFQQTAPVWKYRAPEKLVYRFVGGKLVVARDDRQRLTLNSANAFIPSLPGIGAGRLAAWLNSRLANAFFRARFHELKILRWHLETMPIPDFLAALPPEIDDLILRAERGEENPARIEAVVAAAAAEYVPVRMWDDQD